MDGYLFALGSAIWLGVLTSISPCPLAANIAAISYIGKRVDRPAKVLTSGLLYTFGRMITYVLLGMLVISSLLSIPELAMFLQKQMNRFMGPILILVGLFLTGLFSFRIPDGGLTQKLAGKMERWGLWGALLIGMLFALTFCPVSAALFFGSLIPLAVDQESSFVMPLLYGIGTAAPVVAFAVLIALGTKYIGTLFNKLSTFEKWARKVTGVIFIVVGTYYSLIYLFGFDI